MDYVYEAKMTPKRTVLMGKGDLACKVAQWFKASIRYDLVQVVPDLPEPAWTSSLTQWAGENGVDVCESGNYRDAIPNIDLCMSVFYGKIVKKDFIESCGEVINLHNSPLPYYKGVRPINWAMKNGEKYHGVTLHRIAPGIDDGPIYGQLTYPIYPQVESVEDVYNKSLWYGWMLFKDVMDKFEHLEPYPQEGEGSYYSSKDVDKLGEWGDWDKK